MTTEEKEPLDAQLAKIAEVSEVRDLKPMVFQNGDTLIIKPLDNSQKDSVELN